MNSLLWVLQVLLAMVFLATGTLKLVRQKDQLVRSMGGLEGYSQPVIRLIGAAEVLGAIGLILPPLTGILPWLTPLAAGGLVLVMVGANLTHYRRKEFPNIALTSALLVLAGLVMVGRAWIIPF